MDAVVVENISKNYRIYAKPADRLKELIGLGKKRYREFWALQQVSFNVKRGSTFGVVGENGSGKSTLLQIIAGTLRPTEGKVTLGGRVAALLELGAGFNPEFTGRENVFLNGAILGLNDQEILHKLPEIERFAEIGNFIDQPVKTYSSGMYIRLAFAVSINVDPEILLVDESLSVGDVYFQQRCMRKIRQMKQAGKTILFVSHDTAAVKNLCDSAVWLEHGKIMEFGDPDVVVARYLAAMTLRRDPYAVESLPAPEAGNIATAPKAASADLIVRSIPNIDHRWGNGQAEILGVQMLDKHGTIVQSLYHGDLLTVRISARFKQDVSNPIVGFMLRNRLGEDISGMNTSSEGFLLPCAQSSQVYTVDFQLQLPTLHPGNYYFTVAVANGTYEEYVICDWVENAIMVELKKRSIVYGYMKCDCQIALRFAGTEEARQ